MINKVIETKKGKVEFSLRGEGHAVLFVHGGHSNSRELLAHKGIDLTRYQLITPSRPGYGQTPLLPHPSPKATAELLVALLDELEIRRVILTGISAGGPVALELAASFPERVTRLVLISAVTKKWLSEKDPAYVKGRKLFSPSAERYSWGLFKFFYAMFPGVMAGTLFQELSTVKGAGITKEEIEELRTMVREQRSHSGFIYDLDQQPAEPEVFSKISCPTLIVHSLNDRSVPVEHAHFAHQHIKDSALKTYRNKWGHLVWIGDDSEKIIQDLMNFIQQDLSHLVSENL